MYASGLSNWYVYLSRWTGFRNQWAWEKGMGTPFRSRKIGVGQGQQAVTVTSLRCFGKIHIDIMPSLSLPVLVSSANK